MNRVYGDAGKIIHNCAENFIKNRIDIEMYLDIDKTIEENEIENLNEEKLNKYILMLKVNWQLNELNTSPGFNNKPLSFEEYKTSLLNLLNFINKKKKIKIAEKRFLFDFIKNERAIINIKGYIDAIDEVNDTIYDWKTNSNFMNFSTAAKMYAYAYYKMYNKVPKIVYYYTKLDKTQQYEFTEQEILDFEEYLKTIAYEIIYKGFDIEKYNEGEWQNSFNMHLQKCKNEVRKRTKKYIEYDILNNKVQFYEVFNELEELIDVRFSYFITGHEFSDLFQKKIWDGKVHLYNKRNKTLALGLLSLLENFINDYNEYFNQNFYLKLKSDYRNKAEIIDVDYIRNEKYEIRYYQEEAIQKALEKKIGILELGTGAGKSLIASEVVRRTKLRTLFLINRVELVNQTIEMFEDYIGVKPGFIVEGEMNVKNHITIASIQSIISILKKNNEETIKLKKYLKNVGMLIYDECHGVKDDGSYKEISKYVINAEHILGLTGTAFRNDEHTLKMKALVGDVIYKKTTEELVNEGYLTKTKCNFIKNELKKNKITEGYHDSYETFITQNIERNNIIKKIVQQNNDKKILILTKLIKHGEVLNELIKGSKLITSNTNKKDRKNDFEDFKNNEYNVLIGSYMIFSTGINLPDLDIIINASGNKTTVGTIQSIGRSMRKSQGKDIAYYYDFCDDGVKYFRESSKQRQEILKKFKHEVVFIDEI